MHEILSEIDMGEKTKSWFHACHSEVTVCVRDFGVLWCRSKQLQATEWRERVKQWQISALSDSVWVYCVCEREIEKVCCAISCCESVVSKLLGFFLFCGKQQAYISRIFMSTLQNDINICAIYSKSCFHRRKKYIFWMTWEWTNDDIIFNFGWTIPLTSTFKTKINLHTFRYFFIISEGSSCLS